MSQNRTSTKSFQIDDNRLEDHHQWEECGNGKAATFKDELITEKVKPLRRNKILERQHRRIFAQNRSNSVSHYPAILEEHDIDYMVEAIVKDARDYDFQSDFSDIPSLGVIQTASLISIGMKVKFILTI